MQGPLRHCPFPSSTPATWPFLALVVIALILGLRRGRRLVISHVLLLLATAALGFGILRNIPLFCIAAVPIIVEMGAERRCPEFLSSGAWIPGYLRSTRL